MTGRALTIALTLLLLAPAADAKEIAGVAVCGADDCVRVTQADLPNETLHLLAESIGEADPPAAAAPWYRVKVRVRGEGETITWSQAYVPSEGVVRGLEDASQTWALVPPAAEPVLAKLTRGLRPNPAATLEGRDITPPAAQVHEVFAPARPVADHAATWPWLLAAGAAAAMALTMRRRAGAQPSV